MRLPGGGDTVRVGAGSALGWASKLLVPGSPATGSQGPQPRSRRFSLCLWWPWGLWLPCGLSSQDYF